jgi:hypothetical protein
VSVQTFCVTFGQSSPFKDHWVEVEAIDEHFARLAANYALGKWANVYRKETFEEFYFPGGKIGVTIIGECEP